MADEQESSWRDDLRVFSCHAYQSAHELIEVDGDPQLAKIATALIGATGLADLGQTNDPRIWAAYQAGLLATAVVRDPKGKVLFDRLSEIESIDATRQIAVDAARESNLKWTPDVDRKAREIQSELPAGMVDNAAEKRIKGLLIERHNIDVSISTIHRRLFTPQD